MPPRYTIFLSYAREDHAVAEASAFALRGAGHDVFFDRLTLAAGDDYRSHIATALTSCDLLVFLVSSHSIAKGAYTLSELTLALSRWPHPKGHVLPVLLEPLPIDTIPRYLLEVSYLEPKGDIAADIVHAVATHRARHPDRHIGLLSAALLMSTFFIAFIFWRPLATKPSGAASALFRTTPPLASHSSTPPPLPGPSATPVSPGPRASQNGSRGDATQPSTTTAPTKPAGSGARVSVAAPRRTPSLLQQAPHITATPLATSREPVSVLRLAEVNAALTEDIRRLRLLVAEGRAEVIREKARFKENGLIAQSSEHVQFAGQFYDRLHLVLKAIDSRVSPNGPEYTFWGEYLMLKSDLEYIENGNHQFVAAPWAHVQQAATFLEHVEYSIPLRRLRLEDPY